MASEILQMAAVGFKIC